MEKVRWGILSTANIAQEQVIPALIRAKNAEVTAIATGSDRAKAEQIAKTFNIEKVYDNYESLLEDDTIDAVYIPLPNHLHKEWVIKAAEHKKHVLCEKPATLTAQDSEEMMQVCEANDVHFMEAFMYYFHPQHEKVKKLIQSGAIGKVKQMDAGFSFLLEESERATNIRMNREKGGGSLYDLGCYTIHAIRHILESEPVALQVFGELDPHMDVDTETVGYMEMDNGVRATFNTSFDLPMRHEYRILGTEGTIILPRAFRPDLHGGEGKVVIEGPESSSVEYVQGDQYCLQVEHLSEAILRNQPSVKLQKAHTVNNIRAIEASYRSLEEKQMVTL